MLFEPFATLPQTVSAAVQVVRARRQAAVAERRAGAALDALAVVTERARGRVGNGQQNAEQIDREVELRSPYLTARQAAAYLGISYSTFRKKARLIKVMPGTYRYRREDLDEYSRAHRPRRKR